MADRIASLNRKTKETDIQMTINLDGSGKAELNTDIPFFQHMLDHLVRQSYLDMELNLRGDTEIDGHHSVEDTGLVLGNLLREAIGDRRGIARYGHFTLPMDETLVTVAIDLSGRFHCKVTAPPGWDEGSFGVYDGELTAEFLEKFAMNGRMNLHVLVHYGENRHHIHEAIFKATGKALRMAVSMDAALGDQVLSTKGVLE